MKQIRVFASVLVAAMLAAALMAHSVNAEGPNAVEYLSGCDANQLARNDDGSSPMVSLPFTMNFLGQSYSALWVNNNGNVTFDGPLFEYTPTPLGSVGHVIIAPFWADVDTRAIGSDVVTYGETTVDGHTAFCVNWAGVAGVGYYPFATDKLNSFQLLLVDRSDIGAGDFDIIMNYDKIQWETGGASGGTDGLGGYSARLGFTNGSFTYEDPDSGVSGAFLDSSPNGLIHRSHGTTQLGRQIFEVRNGQVPPPVNITLASDSTEDDVGSLEHLTATFSGSVPAAGTPVSLNVAGANTFSVDGTVDSNGRAEFSFFGGPTPGDDQNTAVATVGGTPVSSNTVTIRHRLPPLPPVTRSHYEAYIGHRYFANDGAQAGGSGKSGAVIIMMGAAYDFGQVLYGNKKVGGGKHSYDQILQSMEVYSSAYHNAWQNVRHGYVTIVWGAGTTFPSAWNNNLAAANDAGQAMAVAVRKFARWVADPANHNGNDYNHQGIAAGIDIEEDPAEGWSSYPVVKAFLQGYASVPDHPPMINFGADTVAPLCATQSCTYPGRGWTGDHLADVSREPLVAFPCPQVYTQDQTGNWLGLEAATGNGRTWGGIPIYFICILGGDTFRSDLDGWNQFVGGLATQRRMNWFAKEATRIDTVAKAGARLTDPRSP